MTHPTVGRCGDPSPRIPGVTAANATDAASEASYGDPNTGDAVLLTPVGPTCCALPHGHDGWHRDDHGAEWTSLAAMVQDLPLLLAAVDNALRNGSHMTGGNLAFNMLCDRLGVDRGQLTFRPDWAAALPAERG